jgi:hypothetical protein
MKANMESNHASLAVIGIDIAKDIFHIVGLGVDGKIAFRRKVKRLGSKTRSRSYHRAWLTESMISRLERGDHVPSLRTLCRIADSSGRHLEIVFHEHEHADGARHSHPQSYLDPDHQHDHGDERWISVLSCC